MKILIFLLFYLSSHMLFAQEQTPGNVTVVLFGGYNIGVSPTMRGNWEDFNREVSRDYNNSKYPFGDEKYSGFSGGGLFGYRFGTNPLGLYGGLTYTRFTTGVDSANKKYNSECHYSERRWRMLDRHP